MCVCKDTHIFIDLCLSISSLHVFVFEYTHDCELKYILMSIFMYIFFD